MSVTFTFSTVELLCGGRIIMYFVLVVGLLTCQGGEVEGRTIRGPEEILAPVN